MFRYYHLSWVEFCVLICETSEVSAALSCLVFPHEFSGSKLPVNNPNLIYLPNIICSTGKPLASKSLHFPQLPKVRTRHLPRLCFPLPCTPVTHSRQICLACCWLSPELPLLCASTYVQKEEFSAGRRKTGALTLKELYKPSHKLHPASRQKGSRHGAAAVSTEQQKGPCMAERQSGAASWLQQQKEMERTGSLSAQSLGNRKYLAQNVCWKERHVCSCNTEDPCCWQSRKQKWFAGFGVSF